MIQKRIVLLALTTLMLLTENVGAETIARRGQLEFTTEDFFAQHYMTAPSKVEALKGIAREVQSTIIEVLAARSYNVTSGAHAKFDDAEKRYVVMQLERAPLLADLNVRERRARAAFKPDDAIVVARAKEIWLSDTTRFLTDETADITQMMFDLSGRNFAEVSERIKAAQVDLANGVSFDDVVKKYTDDTNYKDTSGKLKGISIARVDGIMGNLIFRLMKEGEVSTPTPTRTGLFIVRLDKKHPKQKKAFDEVKGVILEQMLEDSAKNARLELVEQLNKIETVVDERVFDEFVGKADPALEERRREVYRSLGINVSEPLPKTKTTTP